MAADGNNGGRDGIAPYGTKGAAKNGRRGDEGEAAKNGRRRGQEERGRPWMAAPFFFMG